MNTFAFICLINTNLTGLLDFMCVGFRRLNFASDLLLVPGDAGTRFPGPFFTS